MIMCVLLCYPVSIRIYYQQGVLFLVYLLNLQFSAIFGDHLELLCKMQKPIYLRNGTRQCDFDLPGNINRGR